MSKSLVNSTQLTELLNTINSKITHNSWDTVIRQTNIIIDGNPTTVISYLNNNLKYDATTTDIQLNESNVLEVLLLVYTAFKCEYASFVRDLLNFFFEYISICETSVNTHSTINVADGCSHNRIISKFIDFKQNIVKIIFNLFNFMDLSQHLILSDQTFLKSLISINLFLYYHQHLTDDDGESNILHATYYDDDQLGHIIVLKKVVVQIKDLVDHFRCKNCFVGYDYFKDSKNNTSDLSTKIQELYDSYSLTSKMDRFDDIGLQNDLYDVEMYDPKYLLVTELFEIDKDYFEYYLLAFYHDTHNSYDINVIFQYQNYINQAVTLFMTRTFLKSIDLYINKLGIDCNTPETLLSDSYRLLVEKKDSLTALSDSEKGDLSEKKDLLPAVRETFFSTLSYLDQRDLSVKILKLLNSKMPDYAPDSKEEENIFLMTGFVINIVNSVNFKSFLQTIEIFKQELNSNDDYNLLTMDAHGKIEKRVDGVQGIDTESCKATAVLREILVSISLLVNVLEKHGVCIKGDDSTTKEQCFQDYLRLHLNSVFQCISNFIESTTDEKLQQRLWPILFHLENMGWTYLGVNDDEAYTQYVTIHQYVLMTLGSIELYELSNCKSPKYNQTLYDKMVGYAENKSNHKEQLFVTPSTAEDMIDRLRAHIAFNTLKYDHVSYSSITYIHNSMFNDILSYFPEVYSKNYQFYWYGHKKNIYHIVRAVTQNVIDYHGVLSYRLIIIQWIISTVYIRMKSILKICHPLKKTDIHMIKKQLFVIREEFKAPEALKKDFNDNVDRYLRVIETENSFDLKVNKFNDFIMKKFELFDFAAIEAELTAENVCSGLKDYFEIIKSKLISMSNNYIDYNSNKPL
ncbi:unnamed protein product [Macrosiphum euphorbiae]|uniref:Uncharacterized protein n=1 Tax=Macrosiphum euphorbiae TaxID=13131 RepID=A0AAV0W494_9HEMI|nr:unnamed protein product [Macrosiphum euphorbiae]